jgi:hypothetical protein
MFLTSASEVEAELGLKEMDKYLWSSGWQNVERQTFYLPTSSAGQTLVARTLSTVALGLGECWFQITYWHNDPLSANQELFYGYRKGHGDDRSLAEASVYRFSPNEVDKFFSILCLVLYFAWDARLFDASRTYFIRVDNDGFLDYETRSDAFKSAAAMEFPLMGLKPLHPPTDNGISNAPAICP